MKRLADIITLAVMAVLAATFILWFDLGFGGGLPWWFYAGYVGVCGLFMLPLVLRRFRWVKLIPLAGLMVVTAVLATVPLTPRDHFLKCLYAVHRGMSVDQVEAIMKPCVIARYPKFNSKQDGTISYRHSDDAAYNADFGVVDFRAGRVVNVEFLAD